MSLPLMRQSVRCSLWLLPLASALVATPGWAQASDEAAGIRSGRVEIRPYIEAAQVLTSELSPGSDTVTYTRLAAGVDTAIDGRNTRGALSLRYERQIGWGKDAPDGDLVSGVARVSASLVPQKLTVEAGGIATRARFENNGGAVISPLDSSRSTGDMYAVYAGPSLRTGVGDVAVNADYRLGYTRVDTQDTIVVAPGAQRLDVFEDSLVHAASVHAGTQPGTILPVGVGVGASWYREDISNLDQRVDDRNVRADVTVPVSGTVALVGGVGYEKIEVSNRDVRRDALGNPVIGPDGRYVTDKSSPRQISYDVDGFIWDVGVIWKPSPRTALEAHVGRRYGGTTYYGSFAWQNTARSNLNISVYDSIGGLGGRVNNALVALPTDFSANRNPLTGGLGNCVGSTEEGSCLGSALGSVRSGVFRSRGIMASYGMDLGRIQTGVAAGYDRRKFTAAQGTVLALADGRVDENIWAAAYVNGQIDERSSFATNIYANWFDSGFDQAGSATAFGATAAYNRLLTRRLTATAAVGLDGFSRKALEDYWTASALVGMRYSF